VISLSKEITAARRKALRQQKQDEYDEREQTAARRSTGHTNRLRPDRISPEGYRMTNGATTDNRRKSKTSKSLKVDITYEGSDPSMTPNTVASTPGSKTGLRSNRDLRSPGQKQSPTARETALPDFITQTDRFGNAATPRSSDAIDKARQIHPTGAKPHLRVGQDGKLVEDDPSSSNSSVDACGETLLDSLRLMCCCLVPDDSPGIKSQATQDTDSDRPRLLPKLHADDHGKKCLVLDLDETLVHSSFRAVPGADFVIPVQVRSCLRLFKSSI
jgi:hypothetical protein